MAYPHVFSVTSGKGGVGKTNVCVNLACELAAAGRKVVLLDADLGLANVDIVLGVSPQKNLYHLFSNGSSLEDILFPTPYGFSILPSASGVAEMLSLDTGQKLELLETMDALEDIDYLLVDTGAGIDSNVMYFNIAVQERLLVLTPEPTSLTDAYAMIKVLKLDHGVDSFRVLVNMAQNAAQAKETFVKLYNACDHFLTGISLDYLGMIPADPAVRRAVVAQKPFVRHAADAPASQALHRVAGQVLNWQAPTQLDGNIKFFWKKLIFQH